MSDLNKINSSVDKYLFYGFVLLIPLLILGPAIPDFIIISSSILFLFFKVKNFDSTKYKNYIIFFFNFLFFNYFFIFDIRKSNMVSKIFNILFEILFVFFSCLLFSRKLLFYI